MNAIRPKIAITLLVIIVWLVACLPNLASPPEALTATPNLTLTALFLPTETPPATETPEPIADLPTETTAPEPTAEATAAETAAPPTETPEPPTPTAGGPLAATQTTTPVSVAASGAPLTAAFLAAPPRIDGDINDWPGTIYALDVVVQGSEYYADARDLFGEFKTGWDANYLYLGVLVRDSMFVQTASGALLFQGDSVEVLLDADRPGDAAETDLSADDYQLGFSPGNLTGGTGAEAHLWTPSDREGPLEGALVAARLTDDGWMLEIAIPWTALGVTPAGGLELGLLLSVSDNDLTSKNAQQTVISFQSRNLTDPTTWAQFLLAAP
jgi:hypothetical protein